MTMLTCPNCARRFDSFTAAQDHDDACESPGFRVARNGPKRQWHWPTDDGLWGVCGQPLNQDAEQTDPQNVGSVHWCQHRGCAELFGRLPGGPYWMDPCGCVEYVGDLDAHHFEQRCDWHLALAENEGS